MNILKLIKSAMSFLEERRRAKAGLEMVNQIQSLKKKKEETRKKLRSTKSNRSNEKRGIVKKKFFLA